MTDITPPPELVQQWQEQAPRCRDGGIAREDWLMTRAAQWGAAAELDACCELLNDFNTYHLVELLRAARRPNPPSLKEQALADLDEIGNHYIGPGTADRIKTIRRALEALTDD
jgi:hypothetical protein